MSATSKELFRLVGKRQWLRADGSGATLCAALDQLQTFHHAFFGLDNGGKRKVESIVLFVFFLNEGFDMLTKEWIH